MGAEVSLAYAKANYVNYINGIATHGFIPKDKNDKAITATNFAGDNAWNEVWATRNRTANVNITTVASNQVTVATANTSALVYDKAQREALTALIEETEAAIKAAKTVGEVESVFAAAHEKYKDIATTNDHEDAIGPAAGNY